MQDIRKLKEAGHNTVKSFQMTPMRELLKIKGMSELKLDKLLKMANNIIPCKFISG